MPLLEATIPENDSLATKWTWWLPVAAGALILILILLPLAVPISPVIYFDLDPRSEAGQAPITTLGPAGAAWLHVLSVVAGAAAVGVAAWGGGRVRWWACGLFTLGAAFAAWHMGGSADARLQCGAWIGAAALGLGAAHLAQFGEARRFMVAALVAMLLPMTIQAARYVLVEHPMTVEMFLGHEAETLRGHGWVEGSPQHVKYRQRLTDSSAVGTFGLSNVFASVAAALTVAAAALAHGLFWNRSTRWWSLPAFGLALLGLVTLGLTQSKGGLAALVAGGGVLALVLIARRWPRLRALVPIAAVALVAVAFLAILVRGWMGPPSTWEGERSLLFRFHYLQAAVAMLLEAPARLFVGVGPTGFQELYLQFKNPINPEEVTSTHSVFVDWVTMLGVGGAAWAAMLVVWLWQGGRGVVRAKPQAATGAHVDIERSHFMVPAVVAAAVFGGQYLVQIQRWLIEDALLWLLGAGGFVVLTTLLWRSLVAVSAARWAAVAAFAAAAVILVHNQIEMAFYHLPSVAVVLGLVGLGANGADADARAKLMDRRGFGAAVGLLAVALAMSIGYAGPETTRQAQLATAAAAMQRGFPLTALDALDAAAADGPLDTRTLRWRVSLRLDLAAALAQNRRPDEAERVLRTTETILDDAEAVVHGPSVWRLRATLHQHAVHLLNRTERLADAAAALERAIELSPYNLQDRIELASLYEQLGQPERARELTARVLELNDLNYLDPNKQLAPRDLAPLRARLGAE